MILLGLSIGLGVGLKGPKPETANQTIANQTTSATTLSPDLLNLNPKFTKTKDMVN